MKTAANKILFSAFILLILTASNALAQQHEVNFHWSPSQVVDEDGIVRPEAVSYEVWLRRGDESDQLVATVRDTTFKYNADPGITQRIRVRGIDRNGLRSIMSEWSDPVFFEMTGDIVTIPIGAQLKANYPNPFNPETRIVYGVPEDIKSTDVGFFIPSS